MKTFEEIQNKIITNQWIESKGKGNGSVGITLESMLGKETENFEIPDYKGVELKTKCSTRENYITLFSAVPDSYLFEIKRLLKKYGYPDKQYPQFSILNLSIYGNRRIRLDNHYFKIYVDYQNERVVLRVYNIQLQIIDELTSWSFEILKEKLERKLSKLAFIHAERKYENGKVFYKYKKPDFYQLISFEKFLTLLEYGMIRITFRIGFYKDERRFGQIYDHGTCFSIGEYNIPRLFKQVSVNDQG